MLVLTARGELEVKAENFDAGADDYLTKPFAFAELVMRVKALLRRGPVTVNNTLKIADLELDRLTRRVSRAGRRIELSPKEFSLLEYFVLNPNRVLSRTMIMDRVWDQSFEGLTNIVDVYVRQVRAQDRRGVRAEADSYRARDRLCHRSPGRAVNPPDEPALTHLPARGVVLRPAAAGGRLVRRLYLWRVYVLPAGHHA